MRILIPLLFNLACAGPASALLTDEMPVSNPPVLPAAIMFATEFPTEYEQQVKDAAAFWNEEARQTIFTDDFTEAVTVIYFTFEDKEVPDPRSCDSWNKRHEEENAKRKKEGKAINEDTCELANEYANTRNLRSENFSHVTLLRDWRLAASPERQSVVRHELGHALGFEHYGNQLCLMYPVISRTGIAKGLCGAEKTEFEQLIFRIAPTDIMPPEER